MKSITNINILKGHAGKLLVFALIMAVLITAFVPFTNSAVYGETTDGSANAQKWTVTFVDLDGTVLKVEEVDNGTDATPPTITAKKGYKFLGWNNWYVNVTEDRTVKAVYELVMTTSKEDKGKLGDAGTANPPAEVIAIADDNGIEVIDTSEEAITTSEIIKPNPTPTTVVEGTDTEGLSPTTVVLIVIAGIILLTIAGYFLFMYIRKRRKAGSAS